MFKKTVLVGILLVLFSSMGYAQEVAIITTITAQQTVVYDESKEYTSDLWAWLEVPENLPAPGQTFWVDFYITLYQDSLVKTLKLKLKPSDNKVEFTGGVAKLVNEYTFTVDSWSQIYDNPNDGSILLSRSLDGAWKPPEYKKLYLARLEMLVNSPGSFQISLVKDESEAWYSDSSKYVLKQGNTRILRNSHCIPNPNACSGKCGTVNDGCGGIVTCSGCASEKICVSNACVSPVSQLPEISQQACQAVISTPAASDKVLLQTIGETLSDWGKTCSTKTDCKAGYSCISNKCTATELSVLSPIFAAIKDWLGIKFPS